MPNCVLSQLRNIAYHTNSFECMVSTNSRPSNPRQSSSLKIRPECFEVVLPQTMILTIPFLVQSSMGGGCEDVISFLCSPLLWRFEAWCRKRNVSQDRSLELFKARYPLCSGLIIPQTSSASQPNPQWYSCV